MYLETTRQESRTPAPGEAGGAQTPSLKTLMAEYERSLILDALDASGWHQRRAAARLGILPTTLLEKMKRLGIRRARAVEARPALD
jgi:DNA-binding NtrC family response regulator